jgi:hypothetical protein
LYVKYNSLLLDPKERPDFTTIYNTLNAITKDNDSSAEESDSSSEENVSKDPNVNYMTTYSLSP